MWVRSAFWTGTVKPGAEQEFRDRIGRDVMPCLIKLPGVRAARVLWPQRRDENAPPVVCLILVEFPTERDLEAMLCSEGRQELRRRVKEVTALFDGVFTHIDYKVEDQARGVAPA